MQLRQDRRGARIARPSPILLIPSSALLASLACTLGSVASVRAQEPSRYTSTVRSRPDDAPLEDAAADASVITDDRTPRVGESVPQLLAELPGVTINRTGGIGSLALVSLRGSTWDQVGVYLDGIPLNSAQGGGVDLSTLPLGDIERIEVYRGSSPIAFGSSALGGIISITTRAPKTSRVDAEAGVSSFDTYSAGASGSWVSRIVRVYVGAHYLSTAGDFWFTSDNGTAFDTRHDHEVRRSNDAVKQADGTARAVLTIDRGRELSAAALVFFRDQGLPGYGSVRQTDDTTLEALRVIGSVAYDSRRDLGPGGRLRAQLYYTFEQQRYRDPRGEISITPADTRDVTQTLGLDLRMARPLAAWLRASAVAEGRYQQFAPFDADQKPSLGDPGSRLFGATGLEADALWRRLRLHVIPSLRVEVAHDVRTGRNSSAQILDEGAPITNVAPAARLALVEQLLPDVALHANAGRYSRLPSLNELYGDSGFVLGNPALVPESGWNGDAGASWHLVRARFSLAWDAAFFGSRVDNLIQFQQDAYGRAHAINIGRARVLGFETAVDARLGRYGRLFGNVTYSDSRNISPTSVGSHERILPNRPTFHCYGRPEARWPMRRDLSVGAYADVDITDGNYLDPANLVRLPARYLFGAGLFAEATRAHLMVIASAQNLGDTRSFDFAGFPLPSRSFFLSARFTSQRENSQ
jgi:outer membrane cobalamin receptor